MISASAVTKRHELIMSLVAGLSPIMQGVEASGHEPVRKHWFQPLGLPFIFDAFQIFFRRVWQSARLFDYEGFCFRQ